MDVMVIDFETYFEGDYTLSHMTTEAYVRDPRFETNIVGIKLNEAPAFWLLPEQWVRFAEQTDWSQTTVIAHHAHFDGLIMSHHYGITPAFWLDTLSMARYVDGPKAKNDLMSLCQRHGIGAKGDYLVKAKGKRLADFSRDELYAYGDYCVNDCEKEYQLAQLFLPQIPEQLLRLMDLKIRFFTEPVFVGDVPLLHEAVQNEARRKEEMLDQCGYDKAQFSSSDKFAEILREFGVEPPRKWGKPHEAVSAEGAVELIPKEIYAFAKTDPGMQELLEHEDEAIRFLAETRLAVKSTIIQTRAQTFHDCATRGLLPVYVKPNGTHTTRASAGDGTNWMNMTSVNKLRPELTVIKRAIQAPEGCKIVSADSSQIQTRLTAWLFGQQDLVEAFDQGRDVYSEFATEVYGRPIDRKARPVDDFVPGQVGKISTLSFCFGQGWFSSSVNFLKGILGAPPIQFKEADMLAMRVDPSRFLNNPRKVQEVEAMPSRLSLNDRLIHCATTEGIVLKWRGKNKQIVKGWDLMEQVIGAMIVGGDMPFGPNGFLHTEEEAIVLPSGARLKYPGLQRDSDGASYWNGRNREHIYGGSATNNLIQALEQEIVGAAMLTIADAGYKVATEVYDSIVCVVPDEYAEQCRQFMQDTMKIRPTWAPDLPLSSDSGIGNTYYEAK